MKLQPGHIVSLHPKIAFNVLIAFEMALHFFYLSNRFFWTCSTDKNLYISFVAQGSCCTDTIKIRLDLDYSRAALDFSKKRSWQMSKSGVIFSALLSILFQCAMHFRQKDYSFKDDESQQKQVFLMKEFSLVSQRTQINPPRTDTHVRKHAP